MLNVRNAEPVRKLQKILSKWWVAGTCNKRYEGKLPRG